MTSATDKLRRLLDERGVEWNADDGRHSMRTDWICGIGRCRFYEDTTNGYTQLYVRREGHEVLHIESDMRPPEFIVTPEQAIAATLGRGTLTAEDVRSFLNRNSVFDDTTWPHGRQELVFDEDDLQAMADELNATLGRGTCENTQHDADFMCSVCGKCVDNGRILGFNYCPNCGREVVS